MASPGWIKTRMIQDDAVTAKKLSVTPIKVVFGDAVVTGNVTQIPIQIKDLDGNTVSEAVELWCVARDAAFVQANDTLIRLSEVGAGTEISTTAKANLLLRTSTSGTATLAVTDVNNNLSATYYVVVTPVNREGRIEVVSLTP